MAKPTLKEPLRSLENDLIETFMAGHAEWRPDLPYPESHSDMQAGMMAVLRMFEIKKRPIAIDLPLHCSTCNDTGDITSYQPGDTSVIVRRETCPDCPKTWPRRK